MIEPLLTCLAAAALGGLVGLWYRRLYARAPLYASPTAMTRYYLFLLLVRSFGQWMGHEVSPRPDGRLDVRIRLSLDKRLDEETARIVVRDDALLPMGACARVGLQYASSFSDRRLTTDDH